MEDSFNYCCRFVRVVVPWCHKLGGIIHPIIRPVVFVAAADATRLLPLSLVVDLLLSEE